MQLHRVLFDVAGSYTFDVPGGITLIRVRGCGGGGGGGAAGSLSDTDGSGRGAGGGGACMGDVFLTVSPGPLAVVVGSGGAGGVVGVGPVPGGDGGDSSVGGITFFGAMGGGSGDIGYIPGGLPVRQGTPATTVSGAAIAVVFPMMSYPIAGQGGMAGTTAIDEAFVSAGVYMDGGSTSASPGGPRGHSDPTASTYLDTGGGGGGASEWPGNVPGGGADAFLATDPLGQNGASGGAGTLGAGGGGGAGGSGGGSGQGGNGGNGGDGVIEITWWT